MNSRASTKIASTPVQNSVTVGEILADGAFVELISGSNRCNKPDLLLWEQGKATIAPQVVHNGCTYEGPELDAVVCRAMRFPSHYSDFGSARTLLADISDLFEDHMNLPEREARLLACFSISTWVGDCLPIAPGLVISGPDEELGIDVLRLLRCVCRHPLMLAAITPGGFASLPMQLSPLLLNQQALRPNMNRLFRASGYRGMHLPRAGGRLVDLCSPRAIFCRTDSAVEILGGNAIQISVITSQLQPLLSEQLQDKIANDFQPQLLKYRLQNALNLRESKVDLSNFTPATRRLAGTLAMCFSEDPELEREIVQLLKAQDEDAGLDRANSIECALVEVLLGFIHERKMTEMAVSHLADFANTLLRSRGEFMEYGAEQVGWTLKGVNIVRHRTSSGSQIRFDQATNRQVHRLARLYGLDRSSIGTCAACGEVKEVVP